ncbi:acyl carrier protein [Aliikangiella maris]|uniref:Acyl carrier protein n=2 Tax=Aliikangiella maris TaxID=3162458 RepID=A0ABV2BTZ5_9GAMM
MSNAFEVVKNAIVAIQEQLGYQKIEVQPSTNLLNDLGFASLDIAQLVAMLEKELGVDPFANGATLDQVNTVEEMVKLYA